MRRIATTVLVMLLMPSMLLMAGNRKEEKEQMRTILQLLQLSDSVQAQVPDFLLDDKVASNYCHDILFLTDEQYDKDIERANTAIANAQWIVQHEIFPDEKLTKKLAKQKVDLDKLYDAYSRAYGLLQAIRPRYGIMAGYCKKQLQRRREAQQQTMPSGVLVRFAYREYGSSRPESVEYVLERDSTTARWLLNGCEVADTVAAEVRHMAEHHQTYKCLTSYQEGPSFPNAPQVLGGPPSWSFSCRFEGGTIYSGSECMPVPDSCWKIVNYLQTILRELCKNRQNQD